MAKKVSKPAVSAETKNRDQKILALVEMMKKKSDTGEGIFFGDAPMKEVKVFPSGSLKLDMTLGVGGIPRGRIIEIMGAESSGKTTITLHAIASAQKEGLTCAFLDTEHALDPKYAKAIGVQMDKLILIQPDSAEQALDQCVDLAESGVVDLLVLDSVAALTPKAEIEGDMDKNSVGVVARLMSKALRKLAGILAKNNTTAIFINQYRLKIGVMYGDPRTTTGGESLKYYASIRLAIKRGESFKQGDKILGGAIDVKVSKNKLAAPFTTCEIPVMFGTGYDLVGDIYMMAREYEIFEVTGGTHKYKGEKIAGKKDDAVEWLRDNPEMMKEIEAAVREAHKKSSTTAPSKKAEKEDDDSLDLDLEE